MTEFEKFFNANKDFILKYLIKLTKNFSLAEELTQETFFGLSAYKVISDNREDIVLCGKDSDGVFIKETSATKETLPAIVSAVAKKFDSADVRVLLPSGDGETVICGYGFNSPKNIYMNLLLD